MVDIRISLRKIVSNIESIDGLQAVGFISPNRDLNQVTLVANLASLYAKQGNKVIIIDLDPERDDFANAFDVKGQKGIFDYLDSDDEDYHDYVRNVDVNGCLSVLTSGPKNNLTLSGLLSENKFSKLFGDLIDAYEYIFVNIQPGSYPKENISVLKMVDGILLNLDLGNAKKKSIHRLIKQLKSNDIPIVGYVNIKRG